MRGSLAISLAPCLSPFTLYGQRPVPLHLWWKTRALRRQMREHPPGGRVMDGEVISDAEPQDTIPR